MTRHQKGEDGDAEAQRKISNGESKTIKTRDVLAVKKHVG